jgi:uncharacterized protein
MYNLAVMTSPTISSKLKSLGVKVGARDVPAPKPLEERRPRHAIENVMSGRIISNAYGACYIAESDYAADYLHGHAQVHAPLPLSAVARWARDPRIAECPRESLVFLDTETTGLAGGTGTLPFMIGVGRFIGDQFRVAQFFMRDPEEELALLTALSEWVEPCATLVTFNGRSFDMPLVATRYALHRRTLAIKAAPHLDLLPLARRLWRERLTSRALGSLEHHILGKERQQDDVPGFLIPLMYFDYLRSGDARPMRGIFYHNAMDILAMAALLGHVAQMLADPVGAAIQHPVEYVALAKLYEEFGEHDMAVRVYERSMETDLPAHMYREAAQRLSNLHRKRGAFAQSLELWNEAARRGDLFALLALAKHYEHKERDYAQAERMAREAMRAVANGFYAGREKKQLMEELQYRLERIKRKREKAVEAST